MELTQLEDLFVDIGGQFRTSAFDMREKLEAINGFVMDWDGVFNDGSKVQGHSSTFSEVDALGTSLLRFGFFLQRKRLPVTAIITGEENPLAIELARRENFDAIYIGANKKQDALEHLNQQFSLAPEQICYSFDDVLDIPLAESCGLRLAVKRLCNPVFNEYLHRQDLADYISACNGDRHAVREFCELILCLLDKHFEVMKRRAAYDDFFRDYLQQREQIATVVFEYDGATFNKRDPMEYL